MDWLELKDSGEVFLPFILLLNCNKPAAKHIEEMECEGLAKSVNIFSRALSQEL